MAEYVRQQRNQKEKKMLFTYKINFFFDDYKNKEWKHHHHHF